MQYAKGEWILFVDSDDWLTNDAIDYLASLVSDDLDFLMFDYQREKVFCFDFRDPGDNRMDYLYKEDMLLIFAGYRESVS